MYMFTINQNMVAPFELSKGSSLDLYAIVPGMSVNFSSTYNLNVTISSGYSTLVYQTGPFQNDSTIRENLQTVNFGHHLGRIRVVALENTKFTYQTTRGSYSDSDQVTIQLANFSYEAPATIETPQIWPERPEKPERPNRPERPSRPERPERPENPNNSQNHHDQHHDHHSEGIQDDFAHLFDVFFECLEAFLFAAGFIILLVYLVLACIKRRQSTTDDGSIPPILQQTENYDQYIPPTQQVNPIQMQPPQVVQPVITPYIQPNQFQQPLLYPQQMVPPHLQTTSYY